ncbi:hypothetical protein V5799_029540, partial [Amblyomma americanum]
PPPEEQTHGSVQGYYVGYRIRGSGQPYSYKTLQSGPSQQECHLRELRVRTRYGVVVQAFNAKGAGPASEEVAAQTLDFVPVAPAVGDFIAANVSWATFRLSAWRSGGCPITFFTVLYKRQSSPGDWKPAATNLDAEHALSLQQQLTIDDLEPGTWYQLLVTAQNEAGATEAEYVFATLTPQGGSVKRTPFGEAEAAVPGDLSRHVGDQETCSSSTQGLSECYRRAPNINAQEAPPVAPTVRPSRRAPGSPGSTNVTLTVVHSGSLYSQFLEVDKDDKECTASKRALDDCFGGAARIRFQTLGVREFYDGPRGLLPLFTGLNKSTQIVVCNVDFKRDPTLEKLPNLPTRSTILTVDDLKVGIVGYIDDQVLTLAQPGPTITVTEPLECLRNESKILRAQGCHIVLALGGGDTDVDRHLAESLPDVTAFVVKYENRHAYPSSAPQPQDLNFDQDLEYPINFTRLADGGQAYIFAATNHLQLLGKFQITVQTDTLNVLSAKGTPELLDKDAFEDPVTRSRMEYYKNIVEPEANKVIGTTKVYIDNSVAVCGSGECNGGNMMADAVFDYFSEVPIAGAWSQINAAVVNLGSLGESFDERVHSGELRLVDVFQMYPRNDYYVFITMRGDTLLKMLEHSVDPSPPRSKFLQVSGIRFELNKHATGNESRIKNVVVLCTSCRTPSYERVIWIQWYTLAMSRFLAQGGDRYDFTRVPRGYKIETS